jgi:hypothetical protein
VAHLTYLNASNTPFVIIKPLITTVIAHFEYGFNLEFVRRSSHGQRGGIGECEGCQPAGGIFDMAGLYAGKNLC